MTRNTIFLTIITSALLAGCGAGGRYEKAEDAQDAGRQFIRASLDGDHRKASFYLLKDTTNLLLMKRQQRDYDLLSREERKQHRDSDIRPIAIKAINDSLTSYQYCNTYNIEDTTTIFIVKSNGEWLVDLKSILK